MGTVSRWVLPCYYNDSKHSTEPIKIDLTHNLKLILSNEVWNRKFEYGFNSGLKNTDKDDIQSASIIIFPRFISGMVNETRIPDLIEKYCGQLPDYLKIINYKNWSHNIGFSIIEIKYNSQLKTIPVKKDFAGYIPNWDMGFIESYHRHFAVLKEMKFFFLAGLQLTFPTTSVVISNDHQINDGFFQINSGKRKYASVKSSSSFMHEVQTACDAGLFGSLDVNQGDPHNGWDTDEFLRNIYDAAELMLVLLQNGGVGNGGMNFDAKNRRNSTDLDDIFISHISSMDTLARGLILADRILQESDYVQRLKDRYATFDAGDGAAFEKGKLELEDLAKLAADHGEPALISGKQELLESYFNQYI